MDNFYYAYIIVDEEPDQPFFIASANSRREELLSFKEGDIMNIKGIGRLRIEEIVHRPADGEEDYNDFRQYIEVGFTCRKIASYWTPEMTALVHLKLQEINIQMGVLQNQARINEILDEDYKRTWRRDAIGD